MKGGRAKRRGVWDTHRIIHSTPLRPTDTSPARRGVVFTQLHQARQSTFISIKSEAIIYIYLSKRLPALTPNERSEVITPLTPLTPSNNFNC